MATPFIIRIIFVLQSTKCWIGFLLLAFCYQTRFLASKSWRLRQPTIHGHQLVAAAQPPEAGRSSSRLIKYVGSKWPVNSNKASSACFSLTL